jgi:hypothetical protein
MEVIVMKMKALVEYVLDRYPETRANDTMLFFKCCDEVKLDPRYGYVNIVPVHKLRQIIQNKEGKYLPPKHVLEERKKKDQAIRSYGRSL